MLHKCYVVKNENDFLKFIRKEKSKNWKKIDEKFKKAWIMPNKYPCLVITYTDFDGDEFFGDGSLECYEIMYPTYL